MNKKMIKVLVILLIVMTVVTATTSVFAATFTPDQVAVNTDGTNTQEVKDIGGNIVGIISIIGMIASVAILMILGIKYMMGSAEEKAEYKKTMLPYIIGAVLLFAASGIAQGLYTTFNGWGSKNNTKTEDSSVVVENQ